MDNIPQIITESLVGVTVIFVVILLSKEHRKELGNLREERKETQKSFMEFVQNNNHRVTDLVQESTKAIQSSEDAIRETGRSIQENTTSIRQLIEQNLKK